jgi:hypothetical protein
MGPWPSGPHGAHQAVIVAVPSGHQRAHAGGVPGAHSA